MCYLDMIIIYLVPIYLIDETTVFWMQGYSCKLMHHFDACGSCVTVMSRLWLSYEHHYAVGVS